MIKIPGKIIGMIKNLAAMDSPIEACGYLAGTGNEVKEIFPMTNMDRSSEHFTFDPEEQFKVLEKTEDMEIEIVAVYHSHPETPARMSEEDLKFAVDTSLFYLIYSLPTDDLKAFMVNGEKAITDAPIEMIP